MATLAFLLAALLDPIQAAVVLVLVLVYRGPYAVLAAGVAAAAVAETVMVLAAVDYGWGELMAPRLVASVTQAALLGWLVRLARQLRMGSAAAGSGVVRPGAGRLPASAAAMFESIGGPMRRLAPWHMRAYVRRHLERLRAR